MSEPGDMVEYRLRNVILGCSMVLSVPGPGSRGRFGLVLAGKLTRTDQNTVPHCPGRRLGHFGTGFGSVRICFPAKAGAKPAREGLPGAGSSIEQLKVICVVTGDP